MHTLVNSTTVHSFHITAAKAHLTDDIVGRQQLHAVVLLMFRRDAI